MFQKKSIELNVTHMNGMTPLDWSKYTVWLLDTLELMAKGQEAKVGCHLRWEI